MPSASRLARMRAPIITSISDIVLIAPNTTDVRPGQRPLNRPREARCILPDQIGEQALQTETAGNAMTTQAEVDAMIVDTIARLPNGREIAKQISDTLSSRDGDVSRAAQAKLVQMIGQIWRER